MSQSNKNVSTKIEIAFFKLLETKDFNEISISEITKKANVSRMSFYRNFDTKTDIASDFIKNEFILFKKKINIANKPTSTQITFELFKLVEGNKKIRIMLREENIFIFYRSFLYYMEDILQEISDPITKEKNRQLVLVYRSNGLLGYLSSWCQSGCRPCANKVSALFEKYCVKINN